MDGAVVDYTFVDPEGRNLLGLFSDMFITEEPADDPDPAPSTTIVYDGSVPPAIIDQTRLIAFAAPNTPDGDGPIFNARAEVTKIDLEVGFQQSYSVAEDDLAALKDSG